MVLFLKQWTIPIFLLNGKNIIIREIRLIVLFASFLSTFNNLFYFFFFFLDLTCLQSLSYTNLDWAPFLLILFTILSVVLPKISWIVIVLASSTIWLCLYSWVRSYPFNIAIVAIIKSKWCWVIIRKGWSFNPLAFTFEILKREFCWNNLFVFLNIEILLKIMPLFTHDLLIYYIIKAQDKKIVKLNCYLLNKC